MSRSIMSHPDYRWVKVLVEVTTKYYLDVEEMYDVAFRLMDEDNEVIKSKIDVYYTTDETTAREAAYAFLFDKVITPDIRHAINRVWDGEYAPLSDFKDDTPELKKVRGVIHNRMTILLTAMCTLFKHGGVYADEVDLMTLSDLLTSSLYIANVRRNGGAKRLLRADDSFASAREG